MKCKKNERRIFEICRTIREKIYYSIFSVVLSLSFLTGVSAESQKNKSKIEMKIYETVCSLGFASVTNKQTFKSIIQKKRDNFSFSQIF